MLQKGTDRTQIINKLHTMPAVIDVSLDVNPGEIFVLMGLSGSGKSTLCRCINLLHKPSFGSVKIFGEDIQDLSDAELRKLRSEKISMVFQNFGLLPHFTVLENAMWGLDIQKVDKTEAQKRAQHALNQVGLGKWKDSYPDELSGGMRQRVGLARALAANTDIILMDEAFSALDPLIRSEMQDELLSLQEDLQKTIIFITHDLNEAMYLGNRIAILRDGRLVQVGTGEEILENPVNDYVESFVESVDRSKVLSAESIMVAPTNRMVQGEGPRAALRKMRELNVSYLYVVNQKQILLGSITAEDALDATRKKQRSMAGYINTEVYSVNPQNTVGDTLQSAIESNIPLAVVDDDNRLIGAIPTTAILTALDTNDYPEIDLMGRVVGDEDPELLHIHKSYHLSKTDDANRGDE